MRTLSVLIVVLTPLVALSQDLRDGADVYGPCAGCHGRMGEGGKGGEYPRVAGQPTKYTIDQLVSFQSRRRYNLPMFPYTEPRELSEQDMKDVAAYLEQIDLPTKVPEFKETDDALTRLLAMEKVLMVPRVEGDVEAGKKVFKRRCASCHGRSGQGKAKKGWPRLVGQYPNYLQRQFDAYLRAARPHDDDEAGQGVLTKITKEDFTNILAWLTDIQDQPPEAGDDKGK